MPTYIAKGTHQLPIQEGNPRVITFNVPEEIPLTGLKVRMQFRKTEDAPVLMDMSTDNGKIAVDAQKVIVTIPAADSLGNQGIIKWDLQIYTTLADAQIIGRGTANVIGRITHPEEA